MYNTMRIVYNHINHAIPSEILRLVFMSKEDDNLVDKTTHAPVSLEQQIHKYIIKGKVLDDCNLVGGKPKTIFLKTYMMEKAAYGSQEQSALVGPYSFYRVPPADRDGQPIVRITGIDYPSQYMSNPYDVLRPSYGASVKKIARAVLASHTGAGHLPTPKAEVVGGDLIRLYPAQYSHVDWVLSAELAYDEYFSSLNQEAVLSFREMVLNATKAYIYNKLIVPLDQGKILFGADIGVIRDIVQEYKDAEEKYTEMLGEFQGGAILDLRKQNELIYNMV